MSEQRGQGWIQTYTDYPISASIVSTTSSAILVDDYTYHSFQAYISGTNCSGSLIVESTNIDAPYLSWTVETASQVSTGSLAIPLTGRRKYLRHKLKLVGAASGSVYQISGL